MFHLPTLLLQIGVIVSGSRLLGALFRRFGQPRVVGEMVAGLLLGPSLLGTVAPGVSRFVFPPASLGFLNALSQMGLVLFMFLVGLDLEPELLKKRGRTAVLTSNAGIAVPFALGALLAMAFHGRLAAPGSPVLHLALFLGAAMSVTAFPVLARILAERGLVGTVIGSVAIACAAVDDVTAWGILAAVVLLVRGGTGALPLWATLLGTVLFALLVVGLLGPVLRRVAGRRFRASGVTQGLLAALLVVAIVSACVTEWLGIHALFGAFLAGAVMPREEGLVKAIKDRLEDVTVVLLLPLFFAFTGLRASVSLLHDAEGWGLCALVIAVAVAGKFCGAAFAARLGGMPWREASAIGVLMNTRGLVELVVLNVGLDIGVLTPRTFTMMVLMALATTMMTAPLLARILPSGSPAASYGASGSATNR